MQTQKVQPVEKIHCRSNKQIVLNTDIAIIGGGASGLAAAIEAKRTRPDFDVLIVEKKECTGEKTSCDRKWEMQCFQYSLQSI